MREELVGFLNDAREKLTREVDIDHGLLNKLLKKKVLNDAHVECIKAKPTRTTRIEELLDILKVRDDKNYAVFRKVLSEDNPGLVNSCLPPDLTSDGSDKTIPRPLPRRGTKEELLLEKLAKVTQEKVDLQKRINNLENRLTSVEDENNNYKENEGNLKEKLKQVQNYEKQASSKSPVPRPRQELEKKSQNAGLSKSEKLKKDCPIKLLENIDLIQLGDNVKVEGGNVIEGITWLENRIYIVCLKSKNLFVFDDQGPAFKQLKSDQIEIAEMKDPKDLIACAEDKSLFIADRDQKCLWRIKILNKEARKWPIQRNRRPKSLSISSDNELLALVTDEEEEEFFVYIYKCSNVSLEKKIVLQPNIQEPLHVLLVSVDQFIVIHRLESSGEDGRKQFPWRISRVTPMGDILASFDPLELESISETRPEYMAIGPDGTILVADQKNNRAIMLDSELTTGQVLLKHDRLHSLNEPHRICYVPQKQLHIIGQWTRRSCGMFSIFAPRQK